MQEVQVEELDRYLASNLHDYRGPPVVRRVQGGHSNPTFTLETPTARYILRQKPSGRLLPSAHRIEREYRVQQALSGSKVPVPLMLLYCGDPSIIGSPFYVMSHVAGRVIPTADLPGLAPAERRTAYASLVSTLAELHQVDWRAAGLDSFGRPQGYLSRQIDRWTTQFASIKSAELPEVDRLAAWLAARLPERSDVGIVHGDYRVGNIMLQESEPRVAAVLDWELSTIGDPLVDLGYFCMPYSLSPEAEAASGSLAGRDLERLGIPGEAAVLSAYCRATGRREIPHWTFYKGLALLRTVVIMQGIYARYLNGNAADATSATYGDRSRRMARVALDIVSEF